MTERKCALRETELDERHYLEELHYAYFCLQHRCEECSFNPKWEKQEQPYYNGWQGRRILIFLATHKQHVWKNRQLDKVLHHKVPDKSSLCSTWQTIDRLERIGFVKQQLEMLSASGKRHSLYNKPYKIGWVLTEKGEKYALQLIEKRHKRKRGRPRKVSVPA